MSRAAELAARFEDCATVAIVCHDDPDPDCLASAYALGAVARYFGATRVRYLDGHRLSHPQNQALARYLGMDLEPCSAATVADSDLVALVDHAVPGVHDGLEPDTAVDVVVDHHEYARPPVAPFVDLRPDYGATATILVEYLRDLGVPLSVPLASGLLFALHRERLDNVRHPTCHEYEAAIALAPHADSRVIDDLYTSGTTAATIDSLATAIRNRTVSESCLVSWVGPVAERDALPQAADYLLDLQGVESVLVMGLVEESIHLSARSVDPRVDLGRVLADLVGDRGDAGGHSDMAGGVLPAPPAATRPDGGRPALDGLVDDLGSQFCALVRAATSGDASAATPVR